MPTHRQCLARAEEAERLASLVSYERDRVRLQGQAQDWRERAARLAHAAPPARPKRLSLIGRLLKGLARRRR